MTAKLSDPASLPWRKLYGLQEWKNRRAFQLRKNPLCAICLAASPQGITGATIADHVTPHKGDYRAFKFGELRSLCVECHNNLQPAFRSKGFSSAIGEEGYPVDPRHPTYGRRRGR